MPRFTESTVEVASLEWFEGLGDSIALIQRLTNTLGARLPKLLSDDVRVGESIDIRDTAGAT